MQQRQQEEAEEKVRILEEAHRRQVEEVAALAAAEQREAEWQAQVQQQLARARERQQQQLAAQQQRQQQQQQQQQQQRQQGIPSPSSSSKAEPARPAPSTTPAIHSTAAAAPAASTASAAGQLEGLAAWISSQYMGMGKSVADVLSELRRRGIVCTGRNLFQLPGHPDQLDAEELAQVLRLQARTPSRPSTPPPSRATAPSTPAARPSAAAPAAPAAAAPASPAPADRDSDNLIGLADFISSHYMGMGKTAKDALPELHRKAITAESPHRFVLNGIPMSAPEVAEALRLQPRTPSQPVTPSSSRPVSPSPKARAGPRAALRGASPPRASPAGSRSGSPSRAFDSELEGLAAWISEKFEGMGKSAADTLPGLQDIKYRQQAAWLLLAAFDAVARPDSRSSSPSRSTSPIRTPAPAQIQPAGSPAAAPTADGTRDKRMEGLAEYISTEFMGMGKSAKDALPELRRAGITPSGNSFVLGGQLMSAPEIASVLRLQPRTPSRPSTPIPTRSPAAPSAAPASKPAPAAAPAAPAAPASTSGPSMEASSPAPAASGAGSLDSLAAYISSKFMGMGKSATDVLPELRRRGITASGNSFFMGGRVMSAPEVASALRLQPRTPSRPSTPIPTRAPATPSAAPASSSAPATAPAARPTAPAPAAPDSTSGPSMESLAAHISAKYMGMGKSATDALPELRRKGITASGNGFVMGGRVMDADGIAQALRLQVRTPSRPSTPMPSRSPATPAAASSSYSALPRSSPSPASAGPAAPAAGSRGPAGGGQSAEAQQLQALADWISANFMGMGKSAADALPELRRRGISPAGGNRFSIAGNVMDAPGIAQALRLQPRTPSRSSTPRGSRSASPQHARPAPPAPASSSAHAVAPAPAPAPAASTSGPSMDSLAAWISANYMGMGKIATDTLPELRRKGITASGNSFVMGGQVMSAPEIASALRLQPRATNRPISPAPGASSPPSPSPQASAPSAAPSTAASSQPAPRLSSSASGLESLADFIASNYEGMGKSALDVLPELRRKGIVANSDSTYSIQGRKSQLGALEVAGLLRLKARPGSSQKIAASRGNVAASAEANYAPRSDSSGRHKVTSAEAAEAGTRWLASWIAQKFVGMGKTEADALPELKRRGITCTSVKGGQRMFSMAGQPAELSATEIASLLRLRAR
ncbi:hypothetical protein DUNSADRAFT_16917 [Dunaliella salina]|nr:hypothetical protein DUNSADRAFT_16917 [Dunaliella salina]|eukprot:KAF5843419.1 hypothetical protein DUNSADRAFT_16917 [Dunaliella salina]